MNRRGAEAQRLNRFSEQIIGCAIDVHRALGPGLLESAYEECLCYELQQAGFRFRRQVPLPLVYKAVRLDCGYRVDVLVERSIIVELKTVERLQPVHDAQLLTYLRLAHCPLGLMLNFHAATLRQGLRRLVLGLEEGTTDPTAIPPVAGPRRPSYP